MILMMMVTTMTTKRISFNVWHLCRCTFILTKLSFSYIWNDIHKLLVSGISVSAQSVAFITSYVTTGAILIMIIKQYAVYIYIYIVIYISGNDYGTTLIGESYLQLKAVNSLKCCSLANKHKQQRQCRYDDTKTFSVNWISKWTSSLNRKIRDRKKPRTKQTQQNRVHILRERRICDTMKRILIKPRPFWARDWAADDMAAATSVLWMKKWI